MCIEVEGGVTITVLSAQLFHKPKMALKLKSIFLNLDILLLFLKNYLAFILGVLLESNTTMTKDSFISLKTLTFLFYFITLQLEVAVQCCWKWGIRASTLLFSFTVFFPTPYFIVFTFICGIHKAAVIFVFVDATSD